MGLFKNFLGVMGDAFKVGGPTGNAIKNDADGIAIRNTDDDDYQNILISQADGTADEHGANWLDLKDTNALIEFDFNGSSPPTLGANAGNYGFCHTSGGIYSAGQIYFDATSVLRATKIPVGSMLTTTDAISGTISLIANGVYVSESSSAPYSWTLKGSGDVAGAGYFRIIQLAIGSDASYSSTTSLPDGASVYSVGTQIAVAYDSGTSISVIVDGDSDLTIQAATDNDPTIENTYLTEVEEGAVGLDTAGVITVNLSGAIGSGSGFVSVYYTISTLS